MAVRVRLERRGAHQAERGAAVFIVVMVLTLLTAVGIFAVRSSSLADVAAGYDREGAQAKLVAEYAVTATTSYMGSMRGSKVVDLYQATQTGTQATCQANAEPAVRTATRPGCYRFQMELLNDSFKADSNETVFAGSNLSGSASGATSSLNANETTNATFVVEMTEGAKTGVPPVGEPTAGTAVMLTLTAIAQVRPAAACVAGTAPAAGLQVMRAMITAEGSK